MKAKSILVLLMCAWAVAASPAGAKLIDKTFHQTFAVKEGDRLVLEHGDGNVSVTAWDRDEIDVEVRFHAEVKRIGIGSYPDFEVEFGQKDGTVTVREKRRGGVTIGLLHYSSMERYSYVVKAPAYIALQTSGEDGDVGIEGWRGQIECHLEDGDLEIDRSSIPEGRLSLEDGDVTVSDSEGDFGVQVSDGSVSFRRVSSGNLRVRTEDGDVDLELAPRGSIDWDVQSGDGDVTLQFGQGASAAYKIDTEDGRIRLDLPDAAFGLKHADSAEGKIGGGQGRIRIRTEDGDVEVAQLG